METGNTGATEIATGDGASVVGDGPEGVGVGLPGVTTDPAPGVDLGGAMPTLEFRQPADIMRPQDRTLTSDEVSQVQYLKAHGAELCRVFDGMGSSRELSLAKTRVEEAVMWGVKHITQ